MMCSVLRNLWCRNGVGCVLCVSSVFYLLVGILVGDDRMFV